MLQTLRYNVASVLPVLPYRCGFVCAHAVDGARCRCPDHLGTPREVAIEDMRRSGGSCGPDAVHLTFKVSK